MTAQTKSTKKPPMPGEVREAAQGGPRCPGRLHAEPEVAEALVPSRAALARHPVAIAGALITTVSAVVFIALVLAVGDGLAQQPVRRPHRLHHHSSGLRDRAAADSMGGMRLQRRKLPPRSQCGAGTGRSVDFRRPVGSPDRPHHRRADRREPGLFSWWQDYPGALLHWMESPFVLRTDVPYTDASTVHGLAVGAALARRLYPSPHRRGRPGVRALQVSSASGRLSRVDHAQPDSETDPRRRRHAASTRDLWKLSLARNEDPAIGSQRHSRVCRRRDEHGDGHGPADAPRRTSTANDCWSRDTLARRPAHPH